MDEHTPLSSSAEAVAAARLGQSRVAAFLDRLAASPPQVLLLEGGRAPQRTGLVFSWALGLNCAQAPACPGCPACAQVLSGASRDVLLLGGDGASIKIDQVRDLRRLSGEPPRGKGVRVIGLLEAQNLTLEAANCLLKVLEEPRPGTVFVLTTPQRERLLPTIVSRGLVLTLAWPKPREQAEALANLDEAVRAAALAACWRSGRGWFDGGADKIPAQEAAAVVVECERLLARALGGEGSDQGNPLVGVGMEGLSRLDTALQRARHALHMNVDGSLVLDWLASVGHTLVQTGGAPAPRKF